MISKIPNSEKIILPNINIKESINDSYYMGDSNVSTGFAKIQRSGNSTVIDKTGLLKNCIENIPRFEYDPQTKEYKGILFESDSTNLITQSNILQTFAAVRR